MRRVLTFVLLCTVAVATTLVTPAPRMGAEPAEAAAFVDIGNDDTLVFLTPWETAWLANALENNFKWACAPPGIKVPRVAKFFNKFCSGYKAYTKVAYWRVKTFLKFAVLNGGCGSFVLDGASWRPTRARPATTWSPAVNGEIAHTWSNPGETSWFKTAKGWTKVRCSEYQWPQRQSNIVPGQLPASPAGPSLGAGGI